MQGSADRARLIEELEQRADIALQSEQARQLLRAISLSMEVLFRPAGRKRTSMLREAARC